MSFFINNNLQTRTNYAARSYQVPTESTKESAKTSSANYDTVSISKNQVPSDASFAQILSSEVSKSVQSGTSSSRVQELHDLVQTGQYQVNAQRVAEKLLGYRD